MTWIVGLGLAALAGERFHAEVLAQGSRVDLLLGDPTVDRRAGVIRGVALVTTLSAGGAPLCSADYRRAKKSYFHTLHEGVRIELEGGATYDVGPDQSVWLFAREAPLGSASKEIEQRVRERLDLPEGVRADVRCLGRQERAYLLACDGGGGRLAPCDGEDAIYLVPGRSASAYVASFAARGAAWLGLGLLGVVAAAGLTWRALALRRPIVRDLAEHARATARAEGPRDMLGYSFVVTIVGMSIAVLAIRGGSGLYLWPMAWVLAAAVLTWFLVGARIRRLTAALRIVRETSTSRLADAGGEKHELAVRVAADAPRSPSLRPEVTPAFTRLEVHEVVMVKTQKSQHERTIERGRVSHPRWLPVEDGSGRALLDMQDCRLDATVRPTLTQARALSVPPWAEDALGPIRPAKEHVRFELRWTVLEPGDPLLVYGSVQRIPPPEGVVVGDGGYRGPALALAVQGKTVAYQGDERALERAMRRERWMDAALSLVLVVTAGATIALCVHAATLS